jgi:hypothetical protein
VESRPQEGGAYAPYGVLRLSGDGKTLNDAYTEYVPDGSASSIPYVYERTAGSSGFTGTWDSESEMVKPGIELQIQPWEGGLSFNSPAAQVTKNIKFDGNDYPDLGPSMAAGSASSGRGVLRMLATRSQVGRYLDRLVVQGSGTTR